MKQSISLLGVSGVGKTTLSRKLPTEKWFHYSGDYRIATHYLKDELGDFLTAQAMQVPLLAKLLKTDSIFIGSNLTVDNLLPTSAYMGKLGSADLGGLDLDTFLSRQRQHRKAEIAACYDIGYFKQRAKNLYDYEHFLYDAGGSICELDDEDVIAYMAKVTRLVYIQADDTLTETIVQRALDYPKPMYYNESFLRAELQNYLYEQGLGSACEMAPDTFIRHLFPKLIVHRQKRYAEIAEKYGKMIDAHAVFQVRDEADFIDLIN